MRAQARLFLIGAGNRALITNYDGYFLGLWKARKFILGPAVTVNDLSIGKIHRKFDTFRIIG